MTELVDAVSALALHDLEELGLLALLDAVTRRLLDRLAPGVGLEAARAGVHPHRRPPGLTVVWPISPALPRP